MVRSIKDQNSESVSAHGYLQRLRFADKRRGPRLSGHTRTMCPNLEMANCIDFAVGALFRVWITCSSRHR